MPFNVKNLNPTLSALAPVSRVIPCFRCISTINISIASVAQQTQKPTGDILVENSSGDMLAVLQTLAKPYADWIKIIAFFDAATAWQSQKIAIQTAYMRTCPNEKNYINLAQGLALNLYSLLKFIRQLVMYWGWLRWKK